MLPCLHLALVVLSTVVGLPAICYLAWRLSVDCAKRENTGVTAIVALIICLVMFGLMTEECEEVIEPVAREDVTTFEVSPGVITVVVGGEPFRLRDGLTVRYHDGHPGIALVWVRSRSHYGRLGKPSLRTALVGSSADPDA